MSNGNNLRKGVVGTGESAVSEHTGKGGCGFDFDVALDLIQRLSVGLIAYSKTVEAESAVSVSVRRYINIGVVEVVEWQVPVTAARQ